MAFQYHPDKNSNSSVSVAKFREITEAYDILSDEVKVLIYHEWYLEFIRQQKAASIDVALNTEALEHKASSATTATTVPSFASSFAQASEDFQPNVNPLYRDIVMKYYRPASGRASDRSIEWNAYNVSFILVFISLILYLLISSMLTMHKEQKMIEYRLAHVSVDSLPRREEQHISRQEYDMMLAQEFADSHDSTLLKIKNVDSMMRVIDSLNILNQ